MKIVHTKNFSTINLVNPAFDLVGKTDDRHKTFILHLAMNNMNRLIWLTKRITLILLLYSNCYMGSFAQTSNSKIQKASKKIAKGLENSNPDTLAEGYFDLGNSYYQKGDLEKSESNYQKSKTIYEKGAMQKALRKAAGH